VFGILPELVESAGNGESATGSLSAIYTVLAEGDDHQDPIVDCARAILDGHIVLSRRLADVGHYPAIDIAASVSRCMSQVSSPEQRVAARQFKEFHGTYEKIKELIPMGGYTAGMDSKTDRSVQLAPRLERFLRQDVGEGADLDECVMQRQRLVQS
jgi:flagellum-specific ATP synthase